MSQLELFDADSEFDFLDDLIDNPDRDPEYESTVKIKPSAIRKRGRQKFINGMKRQHLTELLTAVPEPEEYVHIVSNGRYDYYTFIPVFNDLVGKIEELWGSTWTMNRNNAEDLLHRYDIGLIKSIHVITGIYFKRRETAVYATLVQGLAKRGQHYNSTENHAKVLLIRTEDNRYFVVEGSANWTANPRIEQNIVTQSKTLYDFHKSWMQTYFNPDKKQNPEEELG